LGGAERADLGGKFYLICSANYKKPSKTVNAEKRPLWGHKIRPWATSKGFSLFGDHDLK
jgi:hypothetical protein